MAVLWRWCFLHWAHCCLSGLGSLVELLCQRVPWCPWHGPLFSCHPATDPPSLTAESIPVAFHLLHFHFLPSEPPTPPPPFLPRAGGGLCWDQGPPSCRLTYIRNRVLGQSPDHTSTTSPAFSPFLTLSVMSTLLSHPTSFPYSLSLGLCSFVSF